MVSIKSEEEANDLLDSEFLSFRKKKMINANPFGLPNRMWAFMLSKVGVDKDSIWFEFSKKNRNKLLNVLLNDVYEVNRKTTFKEEFVTCSGVNRADINMQTMESHVSMIMYFAGEVIDVDGITGGFNFQTTWTTGFVAGTLLS